MQAYDQAPLECSPLYLCGSLEQVWYPGFERAVTRGPASRPASLRVNPTFLIGIAFWLYHALIPNFPCHRVLYSVVTVEHSNTVFQCTLGLKGRLYMLDFIDNSGTRRDVTNLYIYPYVSPYISPASRSKQSILLN